MSRRTLFFMTILMAAASASASEQVQWGPVSLGDDISVLHVPGKLIPKEGGLSVESARIQGRVTAILRREGESVSPGDPLFAVNSAECVSLTEEKRVAQERGLEDLIKGSEAREEQLGLRVRHGGCEVLATHRGTIVKRQVELGATFNVGDVLATVLDEKDLDIELDLPERDLALVHAGQKVVLQMPSYPGKRFDARVDRILPAIDPQTRTSRVRLSHVRLPPGSTLDALVLAEINVDTNERILKVPTTALVFHENRQYVVKNSARPEAVPVEVVSETDSESSIRPRDKDQLTAHDQVAVRGAIFVYNTLKGPDAPLP